MLDHHQKQLIHAAQRSFELRKQRFIRVTAAIEAMSPLKVLGRGYAIAMREDGSAVRRATDLSVGDSVSVRFAEGKANCEVTAIES